MINWIVSFETFSMETTQVSNILLLPKVNTTRHGLTSFKYFAAKQRNMLPDSIRSKAGTKDFIGCIRKVNF